MRLVRFLSTLALGAALAALAACGESVGDLSGTVKDDAGPVEGALVTVAGASQLTTKDGHFQFTGLLARTWTVSAIKDGYLPASSDVTVSEDKAATAELTLTKPVAPNHVPVLAGFSGTPTQLAPGAKAKLLATASDADSDTLSYSFTVDEGWTLKAGDQPGTAELTAPAKNGQTATVHVTVTDGKGGEASGALLVATVEDRAPAITSLVAHPQELAPGATATLDVTANDPDGDALTYAWTASEGWTIEGSGASVRITAPAAYDATGLVHVKVSDAAGATATSSIALNTAADRAPAFASLVAAPNPVAPQGTIQVTAFAADPDGDALTYAWTAPEGWTVTGVGDVVTVTAPDLHDAHATIEVVADDGHGKTTKAAVPVATTPNAAPILASLTATPPQLAPAGTALLDAAAVDADGEALVFDWTVPEGWSIVGTGAHVQLVAPAAYSAVATVQVALTDPYGAKTTGQLVVSTRDDRAPVLANVTASPAVVAPNGTVALAAIASDPDADELVYTWTAPTGWTLAGTGANVTVKAPSTYATTGVVSVIVGDGHGGTASGQVTVATRGNSAPTISSLSSSGSPAARKGTVKVSASVTDPDGDTVTYAWAVTAGWTIVGTGPTVNVTAPDAYGATGTVTLTASDGTLSSQATLLVSTALNLPPALNPIVLNPTGTIPKKGTVEASIFALDPNSDPLTYTWKVPTGWTASGTTGTKITLTAPNAYAVSQKLSVDVSDGTDTKTATVDVGTNADQLPTISAFTSSGTILPGSQAQLSVTASDPDADTLSYSYTITGTGWTISGTTATPTVTAPFANASTATATVTVSDGFGGTVKKTLDLTTSTCGGSTMNCDGTVANGCESDLAWDSANCGACANACSGGTPYCQNSVCVAAPFRVFSGTTGTAWEQRANGLTSLYGIMPYQPTNVALLYNTTNGGNQAYDATANTWTNKASSPYSGTWSASAPWGGNLFMIRGNGVYKYTIATNSWATLLTTTAADDSSMTESDENGHIFSHDSGGRMIDYDANTNTVTYTADGKGSQYETRLGYDPQTHAVYYGGYGTPNLYKYDTRTKTISTLASIPESQLNDIFCSDRSGHIYAAGGSSGTTMWQYDIATNTWKRIPDFPVDHGNNGSCGVSEASGYLYVSSGSSTQFYRLKLN